MAALTCEPITKPWRPRSREHMAYVASFPCLIRGCPEIANVHHLTHAQPKARGLKSGDNWTVPLCERHHQGQGGVHDAGREGAWWAARGIDALAVAAQLWNESPDVKKADRVIPIGFSAG